MKKIKDILRSGTMLAAVGVFGFSTMASGCFGNDDEPGLMETAQIMVDTGKAIVNYGIEMSKWNDEVDQFIDTNRTTITELAPVELKQCEKEKANMERVDKHGSDELKADALKRYNGAVMDLLNSIAANENADSNLRKEAADFAKRYDTMYNEMKDTITKSMPGAAKEEIDKAMDEAFLPAK